MAGGGRKRADSVLLAELAGGATVKAAAEAAGVSERTAFRRMENAEFVHQLNILRHEITNQATRCLTAGAAEAASWLRELAASSASDNVRLAACKALLELVLRYREDLDFEARLLSVEGQLASAQSNLQEHPKVGRSQ